MNFILFSICTFLVLLTGKACLRSKVIRPELILISLASLYLAYPLKNIALFYFKNDFITFDFYGAASLSVYFHFIAFTLIAYFLVLRLNAKTIQGNFQYDDTSIHFGMRATFIVLLAVNSLVLFWSVYQVTEGQILSMLFTSDARKAFLLNQQGQGWLSLLIFFSLPLIALQSRSAIRNPLVIFCAIITFLSLAAIGSRLFIFGYVICIVMHFYKITPAIAAAMFASFVVFGAVIYMGFVGDSSENSVYFGLIYFMRTFDGADILNGYLETQQRIYYGLTLIQEIFVTYVPRAIWPGKPFNFGAIVITNDVYPELQNVQALGATFPPGLFLEGLANFSFLTPAFYFVVVRFLLLLSEIKLHRSVFMYALYVAAAATAATVFRGFGSFLVSLTAFSIVLALAFLLSLLFQRTNERRGEGEHRPDVLAR